MGVSESIIKRVADVPTTGPRPTHCSIGGNCFVGSQFENELAALLLQRLRIVAIIGLAPTVLFFILRIFQTDYGNSTETVALSLHGVLTVLVIWLTVLLWATNHLQRLRIAAVIGLVPIVLFFILRIFQTDYSNATETIALSLHGLLTSPVIWLTILLWATNRLSFWTLRMIELAQFGSMALFFGWLQFTFLGNPDLLRLVGPLVPEAISSEAMRLCIDSTAVRWVCLIVIYGVFVPNPWHRCICISGCIALAPLILTPVGAWWHNLMSSAVWLGVLDMAILMGTAVAIGVFGSHRQQVLQRQAFQARQLGQYHLGKKLGAGGMGEVYKAEHRLLRRPCAIKLIRSDQTRDLDVLQRFEREVQAMSSLTHPNTVEVFDFGQADDGTFYYVMEYLPGMNLEALVQQYGPLPAARVVHFLRQVCRALREAHSVGLLHRDIKPSNIIACERGREYDVAKLLDFGLVQCLGLDAGDERLTMKGTILGSPPYMSPEQAAGKIGTDVRSDIYSLGGVGYYLLTGQPPFMRETAMEMLVAHAYEKPTPPRELQPDVPADVEAVILRCLEKKPADRFTSIEEMEQALGACEVAGAWSANQARLWWETMPRVAETTNDIAVMTTPAS